MKKIILAAPLAVAGLALAACSGDESGSKGPPPRVDMSGVLALTDSEGGSWTTQNGVSTGEICGVPQDMVAGLDLGPRPFPPDAQVTIKNSSGKVLGATSLDTPKKGTVQTLSNGRYDCEFTWSATIPTSDGYTVTFHNAASQHVTSTDASVRLSIGDGVGFKPNYSGVG